MSRNGLRGPDMVYGFLETDTYILCVVLHTGSPPSEREWDDYMATIRTYDSVVPRVRTVVFTDGGGPNSSQRKKLNEFLGGRITPVFLVSSSSVVRGITTALSWFNPQTKTASPDDIEGVFRHLSIPEGDREQLWTLVAQLNEKLGAELSSVRFPEKFAYLRNVPIESEREPAAGGRRAGR